MRGKWNNAGKNILKNDLLTRHFFVWVGVWQRAMLLLCNQICQWRLACHTRGRFVYAATIINCNANGFGTVITWLRKKESRGVEALRMYICMGGSQQSVMLWPSRLARSQMFRINICLQPLDSWIWKGTRQWNEMHIPFIIEKECGKYSTSPRQKTSHYASLAVHGMASGQSYIAMPSWGNRNPWQLIAHSCSGLTFIFYSSRSRIALMVYLFSSPKDMHQTNDNN